MKTAMQEHIKWLKVTIEIAEEKSPELVNILKLTLSNAKSKLKMEKEQMNEFYDNGIIDATFSVKDNFNKRYNKTFKSE